MFRWSSKLAALAVSSSLGLMAQGGTLELVSVSYRGGPSSHGSTDPSPDISDDGRFVVFDSVASDLVINDTNSVSDVFVRDLWQQTTTCVTVDAAGKPIGGYSGGISGDGRYVFFSSTAGGFVPRVGGSRVSQLYAFDRVTSTFELISQSSGGSAGMSTSDTPTPSRDGMTVAFMSHAPNLVKHDLNGVWDIFVRDRRKKTTTRVSEDSNGIGGSSNSGGLSISPEGSWVAFHTRSSNLVWPDRNKLSDVFLFDVALAKLSLVSRGVGGQESNGGSAWTALGEKGHRLWFTSSATNLVPKDTNGGPDIFVYSRTAGTIDRVSVFPDGKELQRAEYPRANGGHVAFRQWGYPALPNNYVPHVALRRARSTALEAVDAFAWSSAGRTAAFFVGALSRDGQTVVLRGGDLTPQDTNRDADIYVRHYYPKCTPVNDATIGNTTRFRFEDPGAAGLPYVAVTGMDFTPGVFLGGGRYLHVAPDALFLVSLSAPTIFAQYSGVLDAKGQGLGLFVVPAITALQGLQTVTSFVVFEKGRHNGVRGVSNSVSLTIR